MTGLAMSPGALHVRAAGQSVPAPTCRGCGADLRSEDVFADLGHAPLANQLLSHSDLARPEIHYRLLVLVCRSCLLVQLPTDGGFQTYTEQELLFPAAYPYRSGANPAWLAHCRSFAQQATERLQLGAVSRVLEIGSNDGTGLLRFRGLGIPAMGVEPCREVAEEALCEGLPTAIEWWTEAYAEQLRQSGYKANLVIARNVLAHVTDLGDFLRGVRTILAPGGTAAFEVPYVGNLVTERQWDQIYHEHHCYFSIYSLRTALELQGLRLVEVEHIPVHGGSLRVYAQASVQTTPSYSAAVYDALETERRQGLHEDSAYTAFAHTPPSDKRHAWHKLLNERMQLPRDRYPRIVGYGASAKAITFINYCGFGPEMLECLADVTPGKQNRYTPKSHIPICAPEAIQDADVVVNFLWNWREDSEKHIRELAPGARIVYLR